MQIVSEFVYVSYPMRPGSKLRAWRGERHQKTVARAAGIPQGVWSFIEQGKRQPTLDQAFRIEWITGGRINALEFVEPATARRLRSPVFESISAVQS